MLGLGGSMSSEVILDLYFLFDFMSLLIHFETFIFVCMFSMKIIRFYN